MGTSGRGQELMRWVYSLAIPALLGMLSWMVVLKSDYHDQEDVVMREGRKGVGTIIDRSDCERRHGRRNRSVHLTLSVQGASYELEQRYIDCPNLRLNDHIEVIYKPGLRHAFLPGHRKDADSFLNPIVAIAVLAGWVWYIRRVIRKRSLIVLSLVFVIAAASNSAQAQSIGFKWTIPEVLTVAEPPNDGRTVYSDNAGFTIAVSKVQTPVASFKDVQSISAASLFELSNNFDKFELLHEQKQLDLNGRMFVFFIYSFNDMGHMTYAYSYHSLSEGRMMNFLFYCWEDVVYKWKDVIGDIIMSVEFDE